MALREATTFAAFYSIEGDERFELGSVPIGKPISNTRIYVLDELQQPVSPGVVGEAYIGGDGLMRGHLNDTQLTRYRLVPNPFSQRQRPSSTEPETSFAIAVMATSNS